MTAPTSLYLLAASILLRLPLLARGLLLQLLPDILRYLLDALLPLLVNLRSHVILLGVARDLVLVSSASLTLCTVGVFERALMQHSLFRHTGMSRGHRDGNVSLSDSRSCGR